MTGVQLQVNDLCVSFQDNLVVNRLNIQIKYGTTTALVGESGSGKSITAMVIIGLLPKTASVSGEIIFESEQLLKNSHKKMRNIRGKKIAMIFQEPMTSLNPVFTIGELLSEVIQLQQRISKKTVLVNLNALLQEVGIDSSRRHAYPHEFSGGMRQRVMIAMALANKPSFLIADEPTTALDATTSKQIIQLLLTAKKNRGMSMLFISHDLRLVASISDEVYVIRSGVVVEHGTSDRVLQHPTNRYTQALLACQPLITNKKARLSTIPDDV